MIGLAQKLFNERYASAPWKSESHKSPKTSWPILEKMVSANRLSNIDLALAKKILPSTAIEEQPSAALICHLSMAARQGHLCVKIENNPSNLEMAISRIIPSPEEVWVSSEENASENHLSRDTWSSLKDLLLQATLVNKENWLTSINLESALGNTTITTPFCSHQDRYYLQKHWIFETIFVKSIHSFIFKTTPFININMSLIEKRVDDLIRSNTILPEQGLGIVRGCQYPLTVITGGPGTGKTYTAGILLRILWESLTHDQQKTCRIALAAPTGKAAANLELSIKRALNIEMGIRDSKGFPSLTATTLHTLLKTQKHSSPNHQTVLDIDILLVDESSMIDVSIMGKLVSSMKPGSRLILLGDRHQLPSVEAGSLFSDLVRYLQSFQNNSQVTELKTCLRSEMNDLLQLAAAVNQGQTNLIFDLLEKNSSSNSLQYFKLDTHLPSQHLQKQLLESTQSHFPLIIHTPEKPMELLEAFSRFRILTPLRKGPFGTERLNALFASAAISQSQHADCVILPIMITRNHHKLGLFNGEMGLLVKFNDNQQRNYAVFPSRKGNTIPALLLPPFEYAYCISIHKSQGSEFNHVLMILPDGADFFGREALYTGITRARQSLKIWSSHATLNAMILNTAIRHSGVVERLT